MKIKETCRLLAVGTATMTMLCTTGCGELLHNLQPHRLQHLNRGDALGGENYNFSVSDPIPEVVPRAVQAEQTGATE